MQTIRQLAFGLVLLVAGPAGAAGLVVQAADSKGGPIAEAVITLTPQKLDDAGAALPRLPLKRTIDQRNETFVPHVELIGRGGQVVFTNSDATRHHVYSFSPARAFALVMAPGEASEPISFERNGIVAIGCNIHDRMVAYVYVSDAPWGGLSDKEGRVALADLPRGSYTARIWHPRLRPGRPEPTQAVTIADANATISFALDLLPERGHRHDRERVKY